MLKHKTPVRPNEVVAGGTALPPSLDEVQANRMAAHLKVLADPMRLRILDLLAQQTAPLCVCDITDAFDLGQPTISHHLQVLRQAGLIAGNKEGIWVYYWLTERGTGSMQLRAHFPVRLFLSYPSIIVNMMMVNISWKGWLPIVTSLGTISREYLSLYHRGGPQLLQMVDVSSARQRNAYV